MRGFIYFSVYCLLLYLGCHSSSTSHDNDGGKTDTIQTDTTTTEHIYTIVEMLDSIAIPLPDSIMNFSEEDVEHLRLAPLPQLMGLGEGTHGTFEFNFVKSRIIRYLMQHHNFRFLLLECDFGSILNLDEYVSSGVGDPEQLLREHVDFWTIRTYSLLHLLEWMKDYNMRRDAQSQLHVVGLDCQGFNSQFPLLRAYFHQVYPEFLPVLVPFENMINRLAPNDIAQNRQIYADMSEERNLIINDSLQLLYSKMDSIRNNLLTNSSEYSLKCMLRLVTSLKQANYLTFMKTHSSTSTYIRDDYLFKNVQWVADSVSNSSGMAIWAHNRHVGNYADRLGEKLYSYYGANYKTIGFGFAKGFVTAKPYNAGTYGALGSYEFNREPLPHSLTDYFYRCRHSNFVLNFNEVPTGCKLDSLISCKSKFLNFGAIFSESYENNYSYESLKDKFDAFIFIRKSSASQVIPIE